jgi:SH3 domain protein
MINKNFLKRVVAVNSLVLLLVTLSPAMALEVGDTVYVDDELRVGVRADASNKLRPHAVVTTGMQLEVLQVKGDYIRIRSADGKEGWIKHTYTSSKPPAVIQLQQLQQKYQALQTQLDKSAPQDNRAEKLQQLTRQNQKLQANIKEQQKTIKQLQSRLHQADTAPAAQNTATQTDMSDVDTGLPWAIWAVLGVLLAVAGFFGGATWHRRQTMKKLGGFSL